MALRPIAYLLTAPLASCLISCGSGEPPPKDPSIEIAGQLNDTGIIECGDGLQANLECPQTEFPAQDAEFGRDAEASGLSKQGGGLAGFDWVKLGADGTPLAVQDQAWSADGTELAGSRWSCVKDAVTGLTWEVKESDASHPRSGELTYNWYSSDAQDNGGFAGEVIIDNEQCPTSPCNTEHFAQWVNEQGLCGASDWRIPSVSELMSIAVYAKVMPALDEDYFPNAPQPRFFTDQTLANDAKMAWYVYFTDASVSATNKFDRSYVRLVRGGNP